MTFHPPYRPSGRSVWLGKDIVQTDDWIVRLSPATVEEIDASVSRLRGRNAYDMPVARDEFPLATMAEDLARMRQEIATGRGFFVFRGLDKDRYSDNELGLIFRGFGAHFGHELTQSAFGDRLGDITAGLQQVAEDERDAEPLSDLGSPPECQGQRQPGIVDTVE